MGASVSGECLPARADATPITTLLSLCLCVYQTRLCVEEGWVLKHRGTEEHRGKDRGCVGRWVTRESVRPTPFLPAPLAWRPVYSGPRTFFRPRSWSGQSNGGGVFLRISAIREDGAGVLSGGGCSRVVVLPVAEAVFELNASTES
jgi:hypothetical protein